MRVAIVHSWFVHPWGGSERVVEALADIFPSADLYVVMLDRSVLPETLRHRSISSSFIQRIPGKFRFRRLLIPLYPLALEQLDLRGYDLVVSSESAPAKGVITDSKTCHICYCHSPMRYIWDMYQDYRSTIGKGNWLSKIAFSSASHYLRVWDLASASRVDYFVANSQNVARRIYKHYRRTATVIHPPIHVQESRSAGPVEDYYLIVSRLVDYKRVDLAVQACTLMGRRLRVVGDGPQYKVLKRIAGPTIQFTGRVSDEELAEQYHRCRALIFPGEEDFGLVPVEAQAHGRPVIAFARGGALETVIGSLEDEPFPFGATGVFFNEQKTDSLVSAILRFEGIESRLLPPDAINNANQFSSENFKVKMSLFASESWAEFTQDARNGARENEIVKFAMLRKGDGRG